MAGFQKDIVERERFAKALKSLRHCQLLIRGPVAAISFSWMNTVFGKTWRSAVESRPIGGVDAGR
jgi:hypothetical protein